MSIKFKKLLRTSLLKIAPPHVNFELVREVELAREKAWHDAALTGGWIG